MDKGTLVWGWGRESNMIGRVTRIPGELSFLFAGQTRYGKDGVVIFCLPADCKCCISLLMAIRFWWPHPLKSFRAGIICMSLSSFIWAGVVIRRGLDFYHSSFYLFHGRCSFELFWFSCHFCLIDKDAKCDIAFHTLFFERAWVNYPYNRSR